DDARLDEVGVNQRVLLSGEDVPPDIDLISGGVDELQFPGGGIGTVRAGFLAGRTSEATGWSASASTSSMVETRWTVRPSRSSGVRSSLMFLAFCFGAITSWIPR